MVIVYAGDGWSSSLGVQVPSGPVCPATPSPLALTSVTAPSVPEDAFTVTWTLGATPVARSAGKTSSTVGGVTGAGVGAAGICCEPLVVELPEAAAEVPWQALSKTLRATSAAARPLPDRDPADGAFTSYRSQVKAAGRCSTEPPREAGHVDRRRNPPGGWLHASPKRLTAVRKGLVEVGMRTLRGASVGYCPE